MYYDIVVSIIALGFGIAAIVLRKKVVAWNKKRAANKNDLVSQSIRDQSSSHSEFLYILVGTVIAVGAIYKLLTMFEVL